MWITKFSPEYSGSAIRDLIQVQAPTKASQYFRATNTSDDIQSSDITQNKNINNLPKKERTKKRDLLSFNLYLNKLNWIVVDCIT